MNIIFFNHYHNGDIHISRKFVRQIIKKVHKKHPSTTFTFSHLKSPNLLADIPNLSYNKTSIANVKDSDNLIRIGDDIYINTWYCQQAWKYFRTYGLTIDCLYMAYNDTCKNIWGFDLKSISDDPIDFFPTIDYSKYNLQSTNDWIKTHPGPKILVENGPALSGQSHNFPMTPLIVEIAKQHTDKLFILTTPDNTPIVSNNIVNSREITQQLGTDLNEISYLSTQCHTIIGRASGVFAFSMVKENLFKRKTNFVCFTKMVPNKPNKFWLGPLWQEKVKYSANFVVSNSTDVRTINQILKANIT